MIPYVADDAVKTAPIAVKLRCHGSEVRNSAKNGTSAMVTHSTSTTLTADCGLLLANQWPYCDKRRIKQFSNRVTGLRYSCWPAFLKWMKRMICVEFLVIHNRYL